jgi:hypothetical protein
MKGQLGSTKWMDGLLERLTSSPLKGPEGRGFLLVQYVGIDTFGGFLG